MTRLMLVDDEMMIRQGIRYAIDWEKHEIQVCGEAGNGRSALQSLPVLQPDIVIADIEMPQMDGFEFIRKAKEILPNLVVIVLTGYSTHEYMMQAIKSGAFDFLEKPADSEIILQSVLKAKQSITTNRFQHQHQEDAIQMVNATANICLSWLLQQLLSRCISDHDIARYGQLLDVDLESHKPYHFLALSPATGMIWPLLSSLNRVFHTQLIRHLMEFGFVGGLLDASLTREEILNCLHQIPELQTQCYGSICVVMDVDPVRDGSVLLKETMDRLSVNYLNENGSVCFFHLSDEPLNKEKNEISPELISMLNDDLERSVHAMRINEFSEAENYAMRLMETIRNAQIDEKVFRSITIQLLTRWYSIIGKPEKMVDLYEERKHLNYHEVVELINTVITDRIDSTDKSSVQIQQAINYIHQHYTEPLTVVDVADAIYLSHAYFGRLFKKEMGKSFNTYLNDVRISEARRLLSDASVKNYEIASKVGFSSYKQFARTFQKATGMTATEYQLSVLKKE